MTPAQSWLVWLLVAGVGGTGLTCLTLLLIRAADGWVWVRRVNVAAARRYDAAPHLGTSVSWGRPPAATGGRP